MPALNRQLKLLILISALVVLTGVAALCVLLLVEDSVVQVVLIALLLLLWPLGIWLNHYRKQRAAKAKAPEAAGQSGAAPGPSAARPAREYEHLAGGASAVSDFLRRNRLGAPRGGDSVYSVPWFLFAGPTGSGKTALLLSAGLSFNALEGQRRSDQNLLRPTRDCDWRVTDDAVMIDTAGRYQTEGADRDEWLGLIETLKKYRHQRPLDGMVIAVSAPSLLELQSVAEVQQQAQVLRSRLNELMAGVGARFPIYLVFTQVDRLPGFDAFFRNFGAEDCAQAWGATIPMAQAEKAHALFDTEFDYLLDALTHRRLLHLSATGTPREQLGVFDFPLHFNAARQKLGDFATVLFSPSPFSAQPLLRGIYFTACPAPAGGDGSAEARVTAKGFFTEDFFKQVLLRDRHVTASLQATQARPDRVRKLTLAAAALGTFCLLLLAGMLVSYFNNRQLLEEGKRAGTDMLRHFRPAAADAQAAGMSAVESEDIGKLQDELMKLDRLDDSWSDSLFHRFGLYTGSRLKPRLREIYFDFLAQRMLNPAVTSLAGWLSQTTPAAPPGGGQPGEVDAEQDYYDRLKAYLMLERQERVEPVFLQSELAGFWREGASGGERRHLAYYAEQASRSDDDDGSVPRPQTSAKTVKTAREIKLKNYAAAKQVYNEIMAGVEKQGHPYYLRDVVQGAQGSEWFEDIRSASVPYRFTKQAYYQHVKGGALLSVLQSLRSKSENDWILDRPSDYQRVELKSIEQRYQNDYIAAWQKFLDRLRVKRFEKKSDAVTALGAFSLPNSPFATIVEQVSIQTKLAEPPTSGGLMAWLKSWFTAKGKGDTPVENSFAALNSFKMEGYTKPLKDIMDALAKARGDDWVQAAQLKNDGKYQDAKKGLRDVLAPLKGKPGSEAVAALLARPLDNVETALGGGVEKDRNTAWANLVSRARQIESQYPFKRDSNVQLLLNDLAEYLKQLTQFYDQHLKDSFDGPSPQMKPLRDDEFSPEFVAYLREMFRVRDALSLGGAPMSYAITLQPPPGQTAEMVVDGVPVKAAGAPQTATLKWPAAGQDTGVKVRLDQAGQMMPVKSYDGLWAIFKMAAEGAASGGLYQFNWNGVRATLQPPANNPFQIDFTRIRAPSGIGRTP
jgi:type VI secretion system protein ImpL